MTEIQDRSIPSYPVVFAELFRLFWTHHKWKILALFLFLLVAGQGLFYRSTVAAVATSLILLLSAVWAELSRHGASHDQRVYHSQMPISISAHHLLKQSAGAVWLIAVFLLAVIIPEIIKYFKLDPEWRGYALGLRESPIWMIPVQPLAVLTVFFTVSAILVAVRKPMVWISLVAGGVFSIWSLAPVIRLPQLRAPFDMLLFGDFSFFRAVAPSLWLPRPETIAFEHWVGVWPTILWFGIACIGLVIACRQRRVDIP
ncbi:hypothetical protein ACFL41_02085 [Gemmatimonadota bacterium]